MASVTSFLEGKLRLKVNQQKSAVAPVGERQFLGHRLGKGGRPGIGRKSLARAKDRLREITRRNRGHVSLGRMIEEVNSFVIGWVTYFRDAECQSTLRELDGWLRRKLRCVKLKRCKLFKTIVGFLMKDGVVRDTQQVVTPAPNKLSSPRKRGPGARHGASCLGLRFRGDDE